MSAPLQIPLKEIESVTNNFSDANFIGEGFLGKIYKGQLSLPEEVIDVAVRRLDHSFWLQDIAFDKEFSVLSRLKHDNMVSIVGFCTENDEFLIVNKHEARGSLKRNLNDPRLTWMRRLQISVGVARALCYLHNDAGHNYSVIHHNINSNTILLDENWKAKLSGFEYSMTIPAGHLDLIYEKIGIGTYKSDVFSFGVVLFEILCGTEAFTADNNKFQAPLAIFRYENRKLHELVSPGLFKQMDPQSFSIFSETGYYCLDQQAPPNMNQVLKRLEKALEVQQRHENNEHSTVVLRSPSSDHLKLKVKNLEHMRIQLKDIELATDNFASENCIVSGGFGTVYKAELDHADREYCFAMEGENEREVPKIRSEVAIKRIFNTEDELGEHGFYAEIEMLTKCNHSNILTLLGFCDEGAMILIYEYASNGSLADYLQNKSNIENDSWAQRMKICLDVAKGLSCLHKSEGHRQAIVHRDIKSANILLGKKMDAKIGDFGLSKFLSANEEHNALYSRKVAGTKVYMDPQYAKEAKLKKESDIYSFGVVLFEILCGMLAYHPIYSAHNNKGLAVIAREHYKNKTVKELVDPKIKNGTTKTIFTSIIGPNQDSVDTFSKIAYQCLAERQENRPTMEDVIKELEKALLSEENRKDIFRISLEDIKLATDNFNEKNCISRDGFWTAYRGEVSHANGYTRIAVKRQFAGQDETVYTLDIELKILMEYKHENVIGLVGYCDEMGEKIIVTEHASSGSLDTYLENVSLTWGKRLQICIDIGSGLDFLHGGLVTEDIVIHRDIKSSNILLGGDLKAKIADFGLSIIRPLNQELVFPVDHIAGTESYIDPQYISTGLLSKECDIYSFGIVLFEILFRRVANSLKFTDHNSEHLGPLIKRLYKEGILDEMMFEGTHEHIALQSLTIFQRIAIQCLHDDRKERPTAGEVVIQLMKALEIQEKGMDIVRIPFKDIKFATNNFSDENLIGRGGFGKVYIGQLPHANGQKIIAAKKLDRMFGQGDPEFYQELEILFKFKHKNVIGLEGYCDEMGERIIVYEYASKKSLNLWLNDTGLTWMKRLEICIDIASGLKFLHGGVLRQESVIHRDIKSGNILINHNWEAKITDFGLSLISPINQDMDQVPIKDTPMGTIGYIDPVYMITNILTKESDIYSLGVVLFELLCGRLAYVSAYGGTNPSLVNLVNCKYEEEKIDEIVFEGIKEHIGPKSLTIFTNIGLQCLHVDQKERPTTSEVVVQLKKALEFQEDYEIWEPKLPRDYKYIIQMSKSPEINFNKKNKDLNEMFSEGILLRGGKVSLWLDSNERRNEMISAKMFSFNNRRWQKWKVFPKSRFHKVSVMMDISNLMIEIKIKTQFLSPGVVYGVYLIFKFADPKHIPSKLMYVNLKYKKGNETCHAYFATRRDDEWMMIKMNKFLIHKEDIDFEVLLESFSRYYCGSGAIYVEGIEFRAIENVKLDEINKFNEAQQVIRSKLNRDIGPVKQWSTYPKEKFRSSEYENELQMFPLNEVNDKKRYMLSAKEVLYDSSNVKLFNSKFLKERSRFLEVFELLSQQVFRIKCKIESQMLSPDTDYICYLVFKLSEKCRGLHCPVKIRDLLHRNNKETKAIYFRSPTPWNLHDVNQVPRQRAEGWMEVNVWKFNSSNELRKECIHINLKLISYEGTMSGLIVCGLEFRPTQE